MPDQTKLPDLKERQGRLFAQKQALQSLQGHPGWVLWCEALDGMVRSRRQSDFATRIDGLDKAFEIATARGEVVGLMLAKALPDILLNDAQADLEKILVRMREEGQENE